MAGEYRDSPWRQGALVRLPAADGGEQLGIVATHDCDICADMGVEPVIEYIPVALVATSDGSMTLGKNARRLHIGIVDDHRNKQTANLDIRARLQISKDQFHGEAQLCDFQLASHDQVVFRRWLSARYARSAFANAFEHHMDRVRDRIDRLAKSHGDRIRAMYFDVDDNQLVERPDDGEPYTLTIYVAYPPDTDDAEAKDFAMRLKQILTKAFFDPATEKWTHIELVSCDALSDDVFPLSLAFSTKPWRVDYRSYTEQTDTDLYPDHGT